MSSLFTGRLAGQEAFVRPILAGAIPWSLLYISKMLLDSLRGREGKKNKEKKIKISKRLNFLKKAWKEQISLGMSLAFFRRRCTYTKGKVSCYTMLTGNLPFRYMLNIKLKAKGHCLPFFYRCHLSGLQIYRDGKIWTTVSVFQVLLHYIF